MATQRKLTAGPSKFDLMLSLFEGKPVVFTLEGGETQEVVITGVNVEDGSRESWNITGYLTQPSRLTFSGHFDTRTRQGFIEADFEENKPSNERIPQNGDRAYTKYHGKRYEGVLSNIRECGPGRFLGDLVPADGTHWGLHGPDFPGLYVGYDERIVWDETQNMWYAPPTSD